MRTGIRIRAWMKFVILSGKIETDPTLLKPDRSALFCLPCRTTSANRSSRQSCRLHAVRSKRSCCLCSRMPSAVLMGCCTRCRSAQYTKCCAAGGFYFQGQERPQLLPGTLHSKKTRLPHKTPGIFNRHSRLPLLCRHFPKKQQSRSS